MFHVYLRLQQRITKSSIRLGLFVNKNVLCMSMLKKYFSSQSDQMDIDSEIFIELLSEPKRVGTQNTHRS